MIDPQWIMAGSQVLGQALGRPAGSAYSTNSSYYDGSGWTVSTGGGSAQGGARSDLPQISPLLIIAAIVGLIIWKKKSKSS